jgi:hypothetical protein
MGAVVHAYSLGIRDWEDHQPRQKIRKTLLQPIAEHGDTHTCHPIVNRRIDVQASLGIKWDPIWKITEK